MNLNSICIILSHPEESRNIGAVCRAMANSGIAELRIVGNKSDYDEERIRILAIHAVPIWERCTFYETITDAVSDCAAAFGTTRRKGKKRRDIYYYPEEAAGQADTVTSAGAKVAAVFGNERTGLTDSELNECTAAVTIPSCKDFASLNLSHAVQILCYHFFRQNELSQTGHKSSGIIPVTLERLDKAVSSLTDNLCAIGFFRIAGRNEQERFWKDILSRAALSEGEVQYIEKIFSKIGGLAAKAQHDTVPQNKT